MTPLLASSTTLKRIHREVADLKKEDLGSMTLTPSEDSLFVWRGTIPGPEGSVYEGGEFEIEITLATDYPFTAPKVIFKTRIYHMNISQQGNICIDILKNNWSPALSLFKVMLSLSSLLTDPNPKDPLVPSIATQYMRNRKLHDSTAREWTEKYARPTPIAVPAVLPQHITMPPIQTTLPSSFITGITPSSSSSSRGKRRTVEPAAQAMGGGVGGGNAGSSSTTTTSIRQNSRLSAATSVIEVDSDSDDSADTQALGKRKRNDVTELPESGGGRSRTKRRLLASGAGTTTTTYDARNGHDVIVIDDDD